MSAPSAPIDASLAPTSRDIYFVLETATIWRTENLSTAGVATWTTVHTAATFNAVYGTTMARFLRVICATTDLIYALVIAIPAGETTYTGYLLRSINRGAAWSASIIASDLTITTTGLKYSYSGDITCENSLHTTDPCRPLSPGGSCDSTPRLVAFIGDPPGYAGGVAWAVYDLGQIEHITQVTTRWKPEGYVWIELSPDNVTWTTIYYMTHSFSEPCRTSVLDSPGGPPGHFTAMDARYIRYRVMHLGLVGETIYLAWFSFYSTTLQPPCAMAVAPTNNNYVYVGFEDIIVQTIDGGVNWTLVTDTHGAYDICADTQSTGAFYYWSSDGNLNLYAAGVITAGLLTETPLRKFGRIAKHPDGSILWAIPNGTALEKRYLGVWSFQKVGLVAAQGLSVYSNNKMIFVDNSDVYTSEDAGATIVNKKGGWAAYSGGIRSDRLI